MDRRSFLKRAFAAGILSAVNVDKAIEQLLDSTALFTDKEFVTYVHFTMSLIVHNPASCARIVDIVGDE